MADNKFSVVLEKVGNQPLMTTKILCKELGLGLAVAKGMVDKAPTPIVSNVDRTMALNLKKQLEEIGNIVSVPGLQFDDELTIAVTAHSSNNDAVSVDEAFDAIFGSGAAQMATPPIKHKCASKATLKSTPKANERKISAAPNDEFEAIFGKGK